MSYEFYAPEYNYEADNTIRDYCSFFPKEPKYTYILCFLVHYFMQNECDEDTTILHASKTYHFIVGCYAYALKNNGLTHKQSEAISELYEKYRKIVITNIINNFKKYKTYDQKETIQ